MSEPKNKGGNNTPKKLNSVEKALLGQYETRRETPDIVSPGQASNLDFDKMQNRLGADFQLHRGEQYLVDKYVKEKQKSIYREQKRKAEEQPWYSEAWGFLAQAIGGEIVLGTLEGAGYLLDLTHWGDKAMGGEGDWSNWLSDLMQDGKEWIREKAPIYVDPAAQHRSFWENALYSDGWWAENGVSIASTLSILIPVAGAARGIGMMGKGASLLGKMGKAGKFGKVPQQGLNLVDDIVKKVPKLPTVSKQISEGVGKAIISRQLENHMEAAGVFREQYKRYKAEGMSDADAKSSASKGAAFTYKAGWAMLLTDIPQYIMMARGFAPSKAILSKKLADAAGQSMKKTVALNLGQYATQFALEGFEEAYQFVVAEEGKYLADVDAGMVNPAETSFSDRFDGYLEDAELWTAAFFGGLGGAVFQAAGQPTTEFINKKLLKKSEDYITQNDLRIQEIKNRKKNIAANTKAYYEALEAGDERAANQARTRIGYDVGITSAQAGNWALAKGNLEQLKNATQAEREEYGLGEDLAENIDSLIADAEKAVELYSRNVNKYEASSVGPITYRQFQIHKFSQLLPQRRNEAEQLKQEMPLINELSEAGKTAFERKLQLKSRQRYIQAAKWKLDNVKLPENEKAALEDSIATHEALLEIDKATLKEAVKEELSQTERVTLNALDGRNAEELSKAEAEIMWMEHYLGQYSEDLVHLTDDNTQREIKKTEEEEAAKIAKGHKNKVNEEKDKRSRDKLNGALSPEEQEAMAQVAGYSEETTVAELSDRIDADPSLWEALDDDAKREIEKYRATKAKVNEDPNYTEAEIEAEGGLTLDSLTRRNAVTDYKKQAANSVEHIEAETPANVDTEENIRRGDDLSTRRVTTLDTPLAWKSSSQVPGTAREADALSTPANVALTNFLESGNSLQGVDVVFSVDQEWLDANPKHKHFSIINRELQAGRVPANIGWVPIKATLHRNGKPLEYGGEVLSMNLHLTKHFINPETNQPYTEHGLSQQTTLERHKTAIVEAALNGNTLKSKVLGKTGGNLNVVRDDNGEFARFSVEETLGNPEDIELVYSNTGMYVDHAGNTHPELLTVIPGDNGAIYAKTETANGTAFPLRLHVDKLSSSEANLIHALYTQVLTDSSTYTQPISDNIRQRIEDSQDPRVSGLASYLNLKTISHKDLLAHLVYEGKKTEHSGMGALYTYPANKKTGAQATLVFGTNKYSVNNILDGKGKTVVLEHLTRNRRRQVDVKMLNNPAYKKYLMDNMILTSNAKKTASNTLFVQPTVSYEDNLVPTNPVTTTSEVTVPTAPKNTENAGVEIKNKAGKITKDTPQTDSINAEKADIERRRQEELDANSHSITVKKEEIVVSNGVEDTTTILTYKKDGSVTYRSFDSEGTELAAGRLKPGYTQEKFNAAIGARYMERKAGDEKSILVEKPIKSRKNLEFKTNKEAKINAKYDAELAALEQGNINQQKQGPQKADIEESRQEEYYQEFEAANNKKVLAVISKYQNTPLTQEVVDELLDNLPNGIEKVFEFENANIVLQKEYGGAKYLEIKRTDYSYEVNGANNLPRIYHSKRGEGKSSGIPAGFLFPSLGKGILSYETKKALKRGNWWITRDGKNIKASDIKAKIDAKYDAKLAALEERNKSVLNRRKDRIEKLKSIDNLLAYHYLLKEIGIQNPYGSDTTLLTSELGISFKEAEELVNRRQLEIKPKNWKLGDEYDTSKLDKKVEEVLKADIERRRQEELKNKYGTNLELISSKNETVIQRNGIWGLEKKDYKPQQVPIKQIFEEFDKINAKYDAELDALKESQEGDVSTKEGKQEIINPSRINPSEITQRNKEVEARLKKEGVDNLFIGANLPTGSNEKALPVSVDVINDIAVATYANEKTGLIDTVISGFSENNFVGYYRIYENGKPTNKWSSKFENQNTGNKNIDSKKKDNFKTMISSVQERLPSDHLYTEKTSISTDGLRVWANQIDRGTYEFALDEKGFYITNRVSINGDALVNELGVDVKQGDFQNIKVRNKKEFNKVKEALLPYLEKLRLNENNIYWTKPTGPLSISGSTVQIDLPVLKPVQKEVKTNLSQKANTELEVDPISEQFALDISSLMPDPDMKEVAPENQEQVQEFKADEAAEAKAKRREARRKIAQENRRKGNTGAFKIFDGLPNSTNIKEIRDAAQHIRSLLPSEIGIELVPDYVQVLSQGKVAVGLFKNGMVTLSERAPKSVAYHEAFHAVFRTMLTVEQRQSLIAEGKKNFEKPRESELEAIMERHDVSLEEATNIFYEEVLADEFGDYMTNPEFAELNYGYSKGIKGLFQRLMNWVNAVFRNKYTTKKLFRDINVGKYRTKTPLISREVRFKAHADFTAAEVREITQQLAYAAFSKVTSLEDVRNYDPNIVINSLLDAQDLAIESNTAVGDEIADRIDLILEENENTLRPFWVNKLQEFVRVNFELKEVNKIDKEQDQDNGDLNQKEKENWLKSSYEVSGKVSATASVKFLVGMIPKVEGFVEGKAVYKKSSLLGLPEFNDFGSTYNLIEKTLSGVVSVKEGGVQQDALKLMKDKLIEQSKYMPEFKLLVDRLNNMSEDVQTSFHFTFSRQRNNYLDHLFVGDTPNMQSRISAADIESKENAILNTWATQFEKNFGYYNSQGLLAYNPEAISAFKVAREEFAVSLTENRLEGGITQNTINQLGKVLNLLGVQMSDKGFNKLIDSYPSPPTVDPGTKLLNAVSMLKIDLFNATNDLLKKGNMQMTSETNHLLNEKTFFKKKSATAESDFIKHGGENSFIGAEGNRYYGYQDNSATSTIVAEIQAGDLSHLEMLKKSDYASNSTWLRWLTDPVNGEANRAAFGLSQYGNVKKLDSQDSGDKASNLKPSDQFIDVFNKYLQGHFVGLAEADKGQQTYFEGLPLIEANMAYAPAARQIIFNSASPQAVDILRGYLADELLRMETARRAFYGYIDNETGERHDPLPEKDQLLYYHYHINKNGERVPGNAFESSLFPDIKLEEFGLRDSETGAIPTLTADNFENNDKLNKYLKDHFLRAVNKDVNKAVEAGLISKTPEGFENIAIGVDILEDRGGVNSSTIANAIATYTLNSIVANVEQTKLFNGDPALYKTKVFEKDGVTKKEWAQVNMFSDFMKRIPAAFASGKSFRIFNEEDGTPAVRSHYSSATIENIDGVTSAFFGDGKGNFNTENLAIISKNTGVTQEELKKLFKPYLKVNQTDAQAWITLKTYRERMRGLGKWSEAHDEAYVKAQSEETLTIDEVKLLAQPLKTVHAELMSTDGNVVSMQYNKQSEAVLLPFMTKGTQLDKLREAMENNGVDHVIVLDGKKVGAKGITSITDSEGNILDANELTLNKVPLSYTRLFLQQDLKAKGVKDTLLGSQLTKVALSVVDLEATYFGGEITGAELVQAFHDTISELSDIGLKEFKREIGYTEELGVDPETLNNLLQREFLGDVSDNILEALESNMDLDALPIKNKIQNKINAILTKKAVRMEQQGGAFIQMSNFGFVGAEVDLTKAVKDNIIWFKDPKEELQPMSMEENGKVKPAQILLPYNVLLAKLKENGIDYQNMSPAEIKSFIDPELLKGIAYRIPNQGPSSNDVFEIVGILPPQAGDTMIAYSSITTKTGSDFDIDKAFVVLPHFYFDGKQLRKTKGKSKRGLQNYRLDLMEEMLTHTSAYPAVMAPLDDPWLEDAAKKWYPEEAGNAALDFFRGTTQLENKATFDGAKNLVGVIANHMTHQGLVLSKGLYFNDYYLGKGKKVADNIYNNLDAIEELENKESTPEIKQEIANLKSDIGGITRKDIRKQSLINGNDSSLSNILDEDGNSIATTLGGFMNAIVDAAKDPFIVRANINQVTAGTAFMLARAGVSREWIVAFMGQPILKEYVKQIGLNEGRFTQDEYNPQTGEKITPMHRVLNKYKITTDPKELYWTENSLQEEANSDITTTTEELVSVLNMVNDKTSNRYGPQERDFQKKVLSQFLIWQQKAKALTEVINVSKVDVNGATANLTRALLAENLLHKVVKEEQIGNLDKLLGYTRVNDDIVFNTKENTSMIGTYHKNSVRAIREIFKGKFMSSTEAAEESLRNIMAQSGYVYMTPKNEKEADKIVNELYAAAATETDAFYIEPQELKELLYGTPGKVELGEAVPRRFSLSERISRAKRGPLEGNLLIQALQTKPTHGTVPGKVYLPQNETTKMVKDDLYLAWEELFDPKAGDPKLAEDLMKYAFYTTGFSTGIGAFYEHIPMGKLREFGFSDQMKTKKLAYSSEVMLQGKEDLVYKNLYQDNALVPVVPNKLPIAIKTADTGVEFDTRDAFVLTENNGKDFIAGLDINGQVVFKPFVKRSRPIKNQMGEIIRTEHDLYQLQGYTDFGSGVYVKTNKLGINSKGNVIKEYNTDGKTSIFPENNVTLPPEILPYLNELPSRTIPVQEYKENEVDKMAQEFDTTLRDRLNFCFNN